MMDIYNSDPHVINYVLSGGIWWIFVFVRDSSPSYLQQLKRILDVKRKDKTNIRNRQNMWETSTYLKSKRNTYHSLEQQFVHYIYNFIRCSYEYYILHTDTFLLLVFILLLKTVYSVLSFKIRVSLFYFFHFLFFFLPKYQTIKWS